MLAVLVVATVIRLDDLVSVVDILDPASCPELLVMSDPVHAPRGDFTAFLRLADREFPELDVVGVESAVLLVGGWRPTFVGETRRLAEGESFLRSSRNVPGLDVFVLDGQALASARGLR